MTRHLGLSLLAATLLSACGGSGPADTTRSSSLTEGASNPAATVSTGSARVVAAVIDSAINPYHEAFHAGGPIYGSSAPSAVTPDVLAAFGIDAAHTLTLTRTGDFARDVAADAAQWARVKSGEAYWVRGTNLILVGFDAGGLPLLKPDASKDPHGVGTSAALLSAAPNSVLVFVEGTVAASEQFAFSHPAIDIVSTSYGTPGSIPLASQALSGSYEGVVQGGKLHVGASDNSPALATFDGTAGPWWSVGVAGYDDTTAGREAGSGTAPDFLASFTQSLPYCMDCETGLTTVSGTSFATPRSAGVAAQVLQRTRFAFGHAGGITGVATGQPLMAKNGNLSVTVWQLRRALERAAIQPSATGFSPNGNTSLPVSPVLPAAQVGWGVLSPDAATGTINRAVDVLLGRDVPDASAPGTCDTQTALLQARRLYWDTVNPLSPSFQNAPATSPLVTCGGVLPALP